ncbi:MAG: L-seryl-tRNA(Sec) selenium transferase [Chloroflexi bacterium]|nr:L-seryl-tRNA(Sec) selenium transferase [Chloroflexota bacterium]
MNEKLKKKSAKMTKKDGYKNIPSVDELMSMKQSGILIEKFGRKLVLYAARELQSIMRSNANTNTKDISSSINSLEEIVNKYVLKDKTIINGTGVIIHTNLGRVPLSSESIKSINSVNSSYTDLEFNINTGKRGERHKLLNAYLNILTGSEASYAVNNNASAIMLAIKDIVGKGEILISRGELVEIGGGFRIPEVIQASGAKLIEVGTTNKTYIRDYENAITKKTKAILKVHSSNFSLKGFTSMPTKKEISLLAKKHNIISIEDLGSGLLIDTKKMNLPNEPTIQDSIKSGIDIVTFSGDKLLGGPQAGIIIGREKLIHKISKNPMARAQRLDKSALSALTTTLKHYIEDEHLIKIPVWQMINMREKEIKKRVDAIIEEIPNNVRRVKGTSKIGGGTMPEAELPTWLLSIKIPNINTEELLKNLRDLPKPIIGRINDNNALIDIRTIPVEFDKYIIQSLNKLNKKYK